MIHSATEAVEFAKDNNLSRWEVIDAATEAVEFAKDNNLSRWEVIDAENELAKAVQANNSCYWVQKAGLNTEACITSQTTRPVEPTFNPMMNVGDPRVDVEQETIHYHGMDDL